jgi:hypothetical protein
MSHRGQGVRTALAAACLGLGVPPALAQVSVPGAGTYTQSFDSLANSGTAGWADNATLPGWFAAQQAGVVTTYTADDGNLADGGLRSYGQAAAAERAFGSLTKNGSPAASLAYGVVFQNTGAAPLTVHVQYDGEWWRDGNAATPETLRFTYKSSATLAAATNFDASGPTAAGFTQFTALDFDPSGLARPAAGARNGNADPVSISADLAGVVVNPGEFVSLRWFDANVQSNDDGLALDNMSVTFTPIPEPGSAAALAAAGLGRAGLARRARSLRYGTGRTDRPRVTPG